MHIIIGVIYRHVCVCTYTCTCTCTCKAEAGTSVCGVLQALDQGSTRKEIAIAMKGS